MKKCLLHTCPKNWSATLLRVGAGALMAIHGVGKLMNFEGTVDFFMGMGLPFIVAVAVILVESLAAIALALGFLTRYMAVALTGLMVGIFFFHQGSMDGVILYTLVFISLIISGGGALSLDLKMKKCCTEKCSTKK